MQAVANVLWSYATLAEAPGRATLDALEAAVARTARSMVPQAVANALWSYATLREAPARATLDALEAAVVRTARSANAQNIANALWSYAVRAVQGLRTATLITRSD